MREDMFQKEFDRLKNLVNHKLYEYLPTEEVESKTVLDAMKYSLSAGGKRVRPILLLAAFQFCGGKEEEAIPYACAIEYIHTYSLIHDDLPAIDNDDMRRGKPTNHMVFGEAAAILAGDGLLNSAFEILFQDMERMNNLSDHNELMNRIRAASTIAHASGYQGMIGGQIADIESEQLKNCHVDKLEFIHKNKTGALMSAAVKAGALLGGAEGHILVDLETYGINLGLAFQIADDLLDIVGDEKVLGKPVGSDLGLHKLTYPSLIGTKESYKQLKKIHEKAINAIIKYENTAAFLIWIANSLSNRNC